jgi:aldehyde oxidoreductase
LKPIKSNGCYRTYDEMKAENIPVSYDGNWTASMCTACDMETAQGSPFSTYMYGLFMAEVAVETKTGKTVVKGYTVIADVGKINSRLAVDGCGSSWIMSYAAALFTGTI